ncbi:MAG: hypothetical protein ACHQ0Y_02315 [Thermodesulfovibrionales bacterium]
MKKEERIASSGTVLFIQLLNSLPGKQRQRFVLRQCFICRILKICQQAEVQVLIPICEKPDFQRLYQVLDVLSAYEHGRDHGKGTRLRRDPFGVVHSRQLMRGHQQRSQPVNQIHRQLACAQY